MLLYLVVKLNEITCVINLEYYVQIFFLLLVPTTIANLSAAPRITTTNSIRASTPSSSTVTNITTIRGTPSTVRTSPGMYFE